LLEREHEYDLPLWSSEKLQEVVQLIFITLAQEALRTMQYYRILKLIVIAVYTRFIRNDG
jgi:hypothetical protein